MRLVRGCAGRVGGIHRGFPAIWTAHPDSGLASRILARVSLNGSLAPWNGHSRHAVQFIRPFRKLVSSPGRDLVPGLHGSVDKCTTSTQACAQQARPVGECACLARFGKGVGWLPAPRCPGERCRGRTAVVARAAPTRRTPTAHKAGHSGNRPATPRFLREIAKKVLAAATRRPRSGRTFRPLSMHRFAANRAAGQRRPTRRNRSNREQEPRGQRQPTRRNRSNREQEPRNSSNQHDATGQTVNKNRGDSGNQHDATGQTVGTVKKRCNSMLVKVSYGLGTGVLRRRGRRR
jgi:hypothetical protein